MGRLKYKVGDKVIISRASTDAESGYGKDSLWSDGWTEEMDRDIGRIVTITSIFSGGRECYIKEDNGKWGWPMFVMIPPVKVGQQLEFPFMETQ